MKKECEICGIVFETESSSRKCCDDCSKNYSKRKKEYSRGLISSKRRINPIKLITFECRVCNRKITREDRGSGDILRDFCSKTCLAVFKRSTLKCRGCGSSLANTNINPFAISDRFCSPECKSDWVLQNAKNKGTVKTCLCCGKEFIVKNKNSKYCCLECYYSSVRGEKTNVKSVRS